MKIANKTPRKTANKNWMRFAEVVDSIESLQEFMKINHIVPNEIIVVWDEEFKLNTGGKKWKK